MMNRRQLSVADNVSQADLGQALALRLGFDPQALTEFQQRRIFGYYLPVAFWIYAQAQLRQSCLMVGINGPQGSGKSTLTAQLVFLLEKLGLRAVTVSVDDFYLTHMEQNALAAAHPGNPYLEYRGYPGTHDVALGKHTLKALKESEAGVGIQIPVYDKSQHGGRGDRAPLSAWRKVTGPFDVLLIEGWMLGFTPQFHGSLTDPHLTIVDSKLGAYRAWHDLMDAWLVLKISDPTWVYRWRAEAEANMKVAGKPGLSEAEIKDYIDRFMPAYQSYLPGLYARELLAGRQMTLEMGEDRLPLYGPTV